MEWGRSAWFWISTQSLFEWEGAMFKEFEEK